MICPHCGSKIDEKALTSNVCPYCGGSLNDKSLPKFENVLPFKISERAAKRAMVEDLFDEEVSPRLFDVFTSPKQIGAYKVYVPMWVFKGSFNANWKGMMVVSKRRYVNDDFGYVWERVKQYPLNGSESGDYCVAVSANKVYNIITSGEDLLSSTENVETDASAKLLECNLSKEKAFKGKELNSWLKDDAKRLLKPTIEEQEYEESNIKEEWDNVKYGVDYDYDECHLVLLPAWRVYYYDDDNEDMHCSYVIDAIYGDILKSHFPKKNAEDEVEESIDISDIREPMKIMGYMWPYLILSAIAALLAFIFFGKEAVWQGGVVSAFTAVFGIYVIFKTSLRQDKQEELKKELIEGRKKSAAARRDANLQDKPLFKTVLHLQSGPVKEYVTDSSPYNNKVRRETALLKVNLLLLIALLILSVGTKVVFSQVNDDREQQERLDEQSLEREFTVDSISYRVLSFDDKTVEVSDGKKCIGKVVIPSTVRNGRNEYKVIQIGQGAFETNHDIASIVLPNTVVSIMDAAFSGCQLASFTPSENLTYVSSTAFSDIFHLGASVPVQPQNGMIYLGKVAYAYVGNKETETTISVRSGIETIADCAFQNFSSLLSVKLPSSLKAIGRNSFEGCTGLGDIVIPRGVEYIGEGAFRGCSNLSSITLYNNLSVIGKAAFEETPWYNSIIGENDTNNIYGEEVTLEADTDKYSNETTNEVKHNVDNGNYSIEDNFIYIGSVLYGSKGDVPYGTRLVVKDGTKGIAEFAFAYCNGLVSVSLPKSMVCIGDYAFQDCKGLERINIPTKLEKVGLNSFTGCVSLNKDDFESFKAPLIGVFKDYNGRK